MPYKTSSEATRRDSQAVVDDLGLATLDVPITEQVDAYFAPFPDASRMRLANKCARERMTVLYDQSAAFEGLVIGTSNKTELLLGYGTQFGDMASAHQSDRRFVQDAIARAGGASGRAAGHSGQRAQRRPVGRPDRRRGVGLQLCRGRPAVGAAGRSPLAAGPTGATPGSRPSSSSACCA